MTGTEKQIAWAENLKAEALAQKEELLAKLPEKSQAMGEQAIAAVEAEERAEWFIEHAPTAGVRNGELYGHKGDLKAYAQQKIREAQA